MVADYLLKKMKRTGEQGFASLVVGLVLVLVMALLAVGFAQLSFREQHQALDNQLANQAYYAAESGINDAVKDLATGEINAGDASNTTCMTAATGLPGAALTANPVINAVDGVRYSCLLVNLNTTDLEYTSVQPDSSRTTTTSTGAPLTSLTIKWATNDSHVASLAALAPLKPTAAWGNNPAVLQFSITPLSNLTRDGLTNSTFTVFAYPQLGGGGNTVGYTAYSANPAAQGQIVGGNCSAAAASQFTQCSVTITGLGAIAGPYLLHFLDFYDVSNVSITGTSGAAPATFTGGQAQIDVTGKAKDVLKRLEVRVPLNSLTFPDYAVEAQNLCKRMETEPGQTTFVDNTGAPVVGGICALDN